MYKIVFTKQAIRDLNNLTRREQFIHHLCKWWDELR